MNGLPCLANLLLPLLLLHALAPLALAIQKSTARIRTTFNLVLPASVPPSAVNASAFSACPRAITHTTFASYRNINPRDPQGVYDGLAWRDLVVDGEACDFAIMDTQSTYFEARPSSTAANSCESPFFLQGVDNGVRRCGPYVAAQPGRYFFSDEVALCGKRLREKGLLPAGVAVARGDVAMFAVPVSKGQDVFGNVCVYEGLRVGGDGDGGGGDGDDGPACFPAAGALVGRRRGGAEGPIRMDEVRVGDWVRGEGGQLTRVVALSHAVSTRGMRFVRLRGGNGTSVTVSRDHCVKVRHGAHAAGFKAAGEVRAGDVMGGAQGDWRVTAVEHDVWATGVYSPVTESGMMLVDAVLVSCYTSFVGVPGGHALMLPIRVAVAAFASRSGAPDVSGPLQNLRWLVVTVMRISHYSLPYSLHYAK